MDRRIGFVISAIEGRYSSHTWNSDNLARLVNLSPSRLQHLFKVTIGKTPMQCLKCRRIQAAEALLRTEFLSVKEIMNQVGLSNYSDFIHEFKREYGVAPGRYRALTRS